jgi:AraC-like DNA-binding protein
MIVPADFIDKESMDLKHHIVVKKYTEYENTRIYTRVQENLLVFVLKGSKRLIYQDFETTIKAGEFAFFKKGNYIMNQILSKDAYESVLVFISDEMLEALPKSQINNVDNQCPYFTGNVNPNMKIELTQILNLIEDDLQYGRIINLKILELLLFIQEQDKSGKFQSMICGITKKGDFEQEVLGHYLQCKNTQELATNLNVSLSTFKRQFQKKFKCTPYIWITEQKLEKSVLLLKTTDYSVTDIGFICGFESLSTYMSLFHKKYGISPGKFRKTV